MSLSPTDLNCVDQLTLSEFHQRYLQAEKPVIIKGGAANWTAVQKWSPDHLKNRFGDMPIKARFLPHGSTSAIEADARPEKPRTLAQFVDTMRHQPADGSWYLVQQPLASLPEALRRDFGKLKYNSPRMQRLTGHQPYFWMGGPGARTGLHYDLIHNFNVQISGRKGWKLFPRAQQPLLYFGKEGYAHHSELDIFAEHNPEYPLLKQATPLEFTLDPGDVLFFPAGWPHCVNCIEESISLNIFSLWFRLNDLKIVFREAPPWIFKKMVFKGRALLGLQTE